MQPKRAYKLGLNRWNKESACNKTTCYRSQPAWSIKTRKTSATKYNWRDSEEKITKRHGAPHRPQRSYPNVGEDTYSRGRPVGWSKQGGIPIQGGRNRLAQLGTCTHSLE